MCAAPAPTSRGLEPHSATRPPFPSARGSPCSWSGSATRPPDRASLPADEPTFPSRVEQPVMSVKHTLRLLCAVGLAAIAASCHPPFQPLKFPTNQALYEASVKKLQGHHWDDAVAGFEQLSTALPARDPLMPIVLFKLGKAYEGKGEDLLAAQSYSRVPESFPTDTLADDAMLAAGRAYTRMW